MKNTTRQYGFTLIEAMITASIAAILVLVAVPSVELLFANSSTRTTAKALEEDLRLGRIEARTRVAGTTAGNRVLLCPYNNAQNNCDSSSAAPWAKNGWMLFVDDNGNGAYDSTDTVINSNTDHAGKNLNINLSDNPTNNIISFGMNGPTSAATIAPINIADANNLSEQRITFDQTTGQTFRERL